MSAQESRLTNPHGQFGAHLSLRTTTPSAQQRAIAALLEKFHNLKILFIFLPTQVSVNSEQEKSEPSLQQALNPSQIPTQYKSNLFIQRSSQLWANTVSSPFLYPCWEGGWLRLSTVWSVAKPGYHDPSKPKSSIKWPGCQSQFSLAESTTVFSVLFPNHLVRETHCHYLKLTLVPAYWKNKNKTNNNDKMETSLQRDSFHFYCLTLINRHLPDVLSF